LQFGRNTQKKTSSRLSSPIDPYAFEMKRDSQIIGAAGEHLVLSRLLNLGYLAAQAPKVGHI
jgi:hypothetical protein